MASLNEIGQKLDRIHGLFEKTLHMQMVDSLLSRYKLKGYAAKTDGSSVVLEDPERAGWYVEVLDEGRVDVWEDGLLKRRIGADSETVWTYWPNRELYTEVWKDLTTGWVSDVKKYTENGEMSDDTHITRDCMGGIVREYVQAFWHTEDEIDEKRGRLVKMSEYWHDLIDNDESLYKVTTVTENGGVKLYETVDTIQGTVKVSYGEHDRFGTVIACVDTNNVLIKPYYSEEGIVMLAVTDKSKQSSQTHYMRKPFKDVQLMTDWQMFAEYVFKKKFKKDLVKRKPFNFGHRAYKEEIDRIHSAIVKLECPAFTGMRFVKGGL